MISALFAVFAQAVEKTFITIGQTATGLIVSIAIAASGVAFTYARKGADAVRFDLQTFAVTVSPLILVWLLILAWHLVNVPYLAYQQQRITASTGAARIAELEQALTAHRHDVDMNEPGVSNMTSVIRAFMKYRRAIEPVPPAAPPRIIVSAAEESQGLAWQLTQWAVLGSGIGNGNLLNLGVRPEHLEAESQRGMLPNVLLIHAVPDAPGVLSLADDLSSLLATKRVFTMPETPGPIPPGVIWLQFGPGLRWNNDTRGPK
jgi:competence protein ComGC